MKIKSSRGCRLKIGSYPYFAYDASGGGGEALLLETKEINTKYVKFSPNTFKIPPLTGKTTKFLTIPLPPGIKISMSMDKLEGTINQKSGEIQLNFEARFTLEIFSIYKFPNLIVKSLLNTGTVKTKKYKYQGLKIQKDGKAKIVGVAKILKTNNYLLNKILFLPTDAIAELQCEII